MRNFRLIMIFLIAIFLLSPKRAYSDRPVSTYISFGETNLLDNNLNETLTSNGYSTVGDKSGFWGMGINGRLRNNIYWNFHFDFYYTDTEDSDNNLSISHTLIIAGISYKLFEKEAFRIMPGFGFGAGNSLVEVTPSLSGFNPLGNDIDDVLEYPFESTVFDKNYFMFNAQLAIDKSLHLGADKEGNRCLFLLGMRTGFYLTLADSRPDLEGVEISNFPENNLDNYYLNFVIGLQFRKSGK